MTGPLVLAVGSASAPGLTFAGDTNSGLYWVAANSIGLTLDGVVRVTYATTGVTYAVPLLAPAATTSMPSLRVPDGTAPTSPTVGDIWGESGALKYKSTSATKTIAFTDGNITGSAATLTTPRTIAMTGDVTWSSGSFNGSANVTAAGTLATVNSNVGTFGGTTTVPVITVNGKGLVTAASTVSIGTAAAKNTGTSGNNVPLLDGANTWSGAQTFSDAATFNANVTIGNAATDALTINSETTFANRSVTFVTSASGSAGYASINLPHGVAPTTNLANGDVWTTTAGIYARINGSTITLGSTSGTGLLSVNNLSDVANTATALSNLGGQPLDTDLTAIAALTSAADKAPYATGAGTWAMHDFSSVARTLVGQSTQALMRTTGLGLGTSSTVDTGTSGAVVPLLNGANTWSGKQTTLASASGGAGLNLPHGVAPSSPANGDFWSTTAGLFGYINGTSRTVAFTDSALTGNTTGSAATLTTTRSITATGDASWTVNFNGGANATAALTIANDAVTNAKLANMATARFKGRATSGTGDPEDLTATQATALLNDVVGDSGSGGTKGLVPAAAVGDGALKKTLRANGTWGGGYFESTEITMTAGSGGTTAHGLGAKATRVEAFIRCKTTDAGFSVDDELPVSAVSATGWGNFFKGGVQAVSRDATNLAYIVGVSGISTLDFSTGDYAALTLSSWRLVLRAWVD